MPPKIPRYSIYLPVSPPPLWIWNYDSIQETKEDAFAQLRELYAEHELDFNFPQDLLARAKLALDNENANPNAKEHAQVSV